MAKIYVIMGKSSSGKDTIYSRLCNMPKLNLNTITLYTTRPKRDGEEEGREYYFTDENTVDIFNREGRIVELRAYNTVYGVWKYFTADDGQVDLKSNKKYIIIATLEAYEKYIKYYGKENVVPIYIEVDDKTRIHRALEREDSQAVPKYAEMCRRFLADENDFSRDKIVNAGICKTYNNLNLEECISCIVQDIMNS
ncbi:MAG: guanylate kinase [Butyrivibrio sp.]